MEPKKKGRRGRKPKPLELRDEEGNLRRRPLPERIIKNQPLGLSPPASLGPAGAELWREIVDRVGVALDLVDRVQLTAMCHQWDIAEEARAAVREMGHFVPGSTGQVAENPALRIMDRAHKRLLSFASEFAATPVARTRVATARAEAQAAAELEDIIEGEATELPDEDGVDGDAL